ncbi:MAG: hypothetical protein MPJ50_08770, partial [Pirellulales bacterium]|nr:hypothetical protein [Pirellulales bacterium]
MRRASSDSLFGSPERTLSSHSAMRAARHAFRRTGEIVIGQIFPASKGVVQTLHAQQLTSNGTANIADNPDVKFSSMLTV